MASARAALLVVLLLNASLALAPLASSQSSDGLFAVLSVARTGDNVTLEVRATRYAFNPTFSITSGGALAALPERSTGEWQQGDTRKLEFALLDPALASATFTARWRENAQTVSQGTAFPVPKRSGEAPDGGVPRLLVTSATRAGTTLTVEITNVGNGTSGQIIAAVEDAEGRKIGSPFYRVLPAIAAGRNATTTFGVSDKLATAVVSFEQGGATTRVAVVVRGAGGSGSDGGSGGPTAANVTVSTDLPFREADIGRTVDYALVVKNTGKLSLVQLEAIGLPSGYSARFFVGGTAVPSLFLDRNQSRQVTLSVTVPNAVTEVDRTIDFTTVARANGTELSRLNMGLAVRGVGRLEINGADLTGNVPPGGTGTFTVTVKNVGSAPLFDVSLDSRRPYGWTLRFDPRTLDRLDPGESKSVTVEVRAPDVVGAGRYSADITAKTGDVSSRATTLAVEVEESASGGSWLWLVFLVVIVGVLAAGYKFRRKV